MVAIKRLTKAFLISSFPFCGIFVFVAIVSDCNGVALADTAVLVLTVLIL